MKNSFVIGYAESYVDPCTRYCVLGNGSRWYSPALMRFTSDDDWSPFGLGGINAYTYCGDDPVNHSDPSGHAPWRWLRNLARRARAVLPDGSIAAKNSAVDATPSTSKMARLVRRMTGKTQSRYGDRRPLLEDNDDRIFEHEVVPDRSIAEAAHIAALEELSKTFERRLKEVRAGARARLTQIEPSRPRSHSLFARYPDIAPGSVAAPQLARNDLDLLTALWDDRFVKWPHAETREAMERDIQSDMLETRYLYFGNQPQSPRLSAQQAFDSVLPY